MLFPKPSGLGRALPLCSGSLSEAEACGDHRCAALSITKLQVVKDANLIRGGRTHRRVARSHWSRVSIFGLYLGLLDTR
jgi:hypothetical protein